VRKGYRVLLRAKVKGSKDEAVFFCTSQNISATGILIETDRVLKAGEEINCSFYLPGSAHITADGEVVRTANSGGGRHHHYGIRFTAISPTDSREIERFIAESLINF
jgi:c-di-GMP-binding flagellar brake protein YcgR